MDNYVWYACYGSNISTDRFLCYINGGTAIGALTSEEGCKDNAMPIKIKNISIKKQQYFAKSAMRWQSQGVAFLGPDSEDVTLGRMYLITKEQFEDVVKQENGISVYDELFIDMDGIKSLGEMEVFKGWYGNIVYLGDSEGYPIVTFTGSYTEYTKEMNAPSEAYIKMIASGIKENYDIQLEELIDYFLRKPGVGMSYDKARMRAVLEGLYL